MMRANLLTALLCSALATLAFGPTPRTRPKPPPISTNAGITCEVTSVTFSSQTSFQQPPATASGRPRPATSRRVDVSLKLTGGADAAAFQAGVTLITQL